MFALMWKAAAIGVLLFALAALWPALERDHSGPAKVIDADTIEILGERHRLYGLDALELDQTCRTREENEWPCGREAAQALRVFLAGRSITCEARRQRDAYKRHLSVCYAGDENINAWLVREGWAVADHDVPPTLTLASEEGTARFLRQGIWAGSFEKPADWRRHRR